MVNKKNISKCFTLLDKYSKNFINRNLTYFISKNNIYYFVQNIKDKFHLIKNNNKLYFDDNYLFQNTNHFRKLQENLNSKHKGSMTKMNTYSKIKLTSNFISFNFNTKFDKSKYLNFERNNIIKENPNESNRGKSRIKNKDIEAFKENSKIKSQKEQINFYIIFTLLNAPLFVSPLVFGIFNFKLVYFNQILRIILNSQLLNNFFFSGILISGIYKFSLSNQISKVNILNLNEMDGDQEKLELKKRKRIFLIKIGFCIFPCLLNFWATNLLLNQVIMTNNILLIGSSSIFLSYFSILMNLKIFKLDKIFGFFENWKYLIALNILFLIMFFTIIYKKCLAHIKKEINIDYDPQPFKIKNDLNRIENLKKYQEIMKDEENKFTQDNSDIYIAILDEIDNLKDKEKQKFLTDKLLNIFEEN